MEAPKIKCGGCGSRDPVMRAVYDWQRTQAGDGWVWLGTPRMLCPECCADSRFGGRWIDERQKRTAHKPAWAEQEPEEFARADARLSPAAAASKPNRPAKKSARPVRGKSKGK